MENPWEAHADEERLERYAMGLLTEAESAPLEEHLLLCAGCREKLSEFDEFLSTLRSTRADPSGPPEADRKTAAPPDKNSPLRKRAE